MKSWFFRGNRRSSESITARLMGSAPRLPPVIRIQKGSPCSWRGAEKNSRRTGMPVVVAFAPKRWAVASKPQATRVEIPARTRLVKPRDQNHGTGGVATDSERGAELMLLHNFFRVPQAGGQQRGVF